MPRRVGLLAIIAAAACCSKSEVKGGGSGDLSAPAKPSFALFALAEVRGQVGPCGCTSDPLGDLSRTAKLVSEARARGPVLVVDAGSLLYSKSPVPPQLERQEELKADLLASTYKDALQIAAVGLGWADLANGPDHVRMSRQVVNLGAGASLPVEAPKLIEIGGTQVGVFGVIAVDAVPGLAITDPIAASKAAIAQLRQRGARVVIGLIQAANKKDAVKLARDIGGIDIAVAGLGIDAPEPEHVDIEPTKIGDGWLVVPANRGQVVSRVDVTVRADQQANGERADDHRLVNAIGPAAAAAKLASIEKQLAALDADLLKFAADKAADPKFVEQKQLERAQLVAQRAQLQAQPTTVPPISSFFTLEQVKISKTLACDRATQDKVTSYIRAAGEANVKAAASIAVLAPPKGKAGYVGTEGCSDCHSDAVEFWNKTVHAKAWKTLVDRGQQFDYDCIGCHTTGWQKPGGANLAHNDNLRDVQCETCHGPGSIHVAKGGEEKPPAIRRNPPDDLCATQCHTKEHSDTFDLKPYLRDVTGPGHGEQIRKQLGDGPTGSQLRKAALDKAGRSVGAGCIPVTRWWRERRRSRRWFETSAVVVAVLVVGCTSTKPASKPPVTRSHGSVGVQEGMASWYGSSEQQGGPTASGERFDKHKLTAAHRTLPMGTRVRVTSKRTGRQVEVRINDRGPYGKGRIIDLSEAAARRLDMIDAGVIPVRIEVLN